MNFPDNPPEALSPDEVPRHVVALISGGTRLPLSHAIRPPRYSFVSVRVRQVVGKSALSVPPIRAMHHHDVR